MSRTFRHRNEHSKNEESRSRSRHHRYDGHKLATMVNHAHLERHSHPVILRTGTRGK